ncbi:MAG: PD40 domain-containing protein [Planctomycetaceae bacterium]|nr:PD40 domain-containing protein [Planctomycetaceae bacterium]
MKGQPMKMMIATLAGGVVFSCVCAVSNHAQDSFASTGKEASTHAGGQQVTGGVPARLMRFPAVSERQIAFVYGGDIWIAPKTGGTAHRLTTAKGDEMLPRFSPNGKELAFSANYDGNMDVYTLPCEGGEVKRLTYHPGTDATVGWHPGGERVLFYSNRAMTFGYGDQLFMVPRSGGNPERLPMPYADFASWSPDASKIAYVPMSRDFRNWKRYRGGQTPDIWLYDLKEDAYQQLSDVHANHGQPMWHGDSLYFISDRDENKRSNIWRHDFATGATRQVTFFKDFDVNFPSLGPAEIVFEAGGTLYLLNLEREELDSVNITIVTDEAALRPRKMSTAALVSSMSLAPGAKQALLEARGDIHTVSVEHGYSHNLTQTSGVAERYPSCSPDGKSVAYWSDASGEYELMLRSLDNGEARQLTTLGAGFRYQPQWSPDGKLLVFVEGTGALQLYNLDTGELRQVDQLSSCGHGELEGMKVTWTSDSSWFAYARDVDNRHFAVFLYDVKNGISHQVTSGFYSCASPVFDPENKYLLYLSDRNYERVYSSFENAWVYTNTTKIILTPLSASTPSPFLPENDLPMPEKPDAPPKDENAEPKEDADKRGGLWGLSWLFLSQDSQEQPKAAPIKSVSIDLEGFESRGIVLPLAGGSYHSLSWSGESILYIKPPRSGALPSEASSLCMFDLKEKKEHVVFSPVSSYDVDVKSRTILAAIRSPMSPARYVTLPLQPGAMVKNDISPDTISAVIDPRSEWKQILRDAWRIERDGFYDPNMHGVDWQAMYDKYSALLEHAASRSDVNYLLGELLGELNASHTYRGYGDVEQPLSVGVGMLGCDYTLENGAYRITNIIRPAGWELEHRSPLVEPGVNVKEGDYLLEVNGVAVDSEREVYAAFQGLAGKVACLTVNDKPDAEGARRVLVRLLPSENYLRYLSGVEAKRQLVEKLSNSRIGYIHTSNTSNGGQVSLFSNYHAQWNKEALLIDDRFNGGGEVNDLMSNLLDRKLVHRWAVRNGKDWTYPSIVHDGPKAMLINDRAGSGGDAFPCYFRISGLGPLIGTTTWGGLIGINSAPRLIDGGFVSVPNFAFYTKDGRWDVENIGVHPDIEVIDDPNLCKDGGDPQLERGVSYLLDELSKLKEAPACRPKYEDRSK